MTDEQRRKNAEYQKAYRERNKEALKVKRLARESSPEGLARRAAWRQQLKAENPKRYQQREKQYKLMSTYNITLAQYDAMLAEQGGCCRICQVELNPLGRTPTSAAVDHCHTTGVVRGILCRSCNSGLGHFREDPNALARAKAYLELFNGE